MVRFATAFQLEEFKNEYKSLMQLKHESNSTSIQNIIHLENIYENADTRIFSRIRPILNNEAENDHFQTVTCSDKNVTIHVPSSTLKGLPILEDLKFSIDGAFGPTCSNLDIYQNICYPLLKLAVSGGSATLFAYGQTGSGKTYTINGLINILSSDLFKLINDDFNLINVTAIEIIGNALFDLFTHNNVFVREDKFGNINLDGAENIEIQSEQEFLNKVNIAIESRKSAKTEKNDTSSRSHMIIKISIHLKNEKSNIKEGTLYLVDLAGSEFGSDKRHHSTERMSESKQINTSLMVLKDCMRGRASVGKTQSHVHIPYRASKLTLIMRDIFELAVMRPVKAAIIACISPSESDCAHSTNTMRYAEAATCACKQIVLKKDEDDPQNWDRERALKFLEVHGRGRIDPEIILPDNGDGKDLAMLPEHEFMTRALMAPKATEKLAKYVYIKVWEFIVDARTRRRKEVLKTREIVKVKDLDFAQELLDRIKEEEGQNSYINSNV